MARIQEKMEKCHERGGGGKLSEPNGFLPETPTGSILQQPFTLKKRPKMKISVQWQEGDMSFPESRMGESLEQGPKKKNCYSTASYPYPENGTDGWGKGGNQSQTS